MSVSWRRSARDVTAAANGDSAALSCAASRKAAIASSNLGRWPTAATPISRKSSLVSFGSTFQSIAFSAKAGAYCSRPSPRSHSAISTDIMVSLSPVGRRCPDRSRLFGSIAKIRALVESSWEAAMWTPVSRCQHSRKHLRYGSDLTDAEWAIIAPLLPAPRRSGRPRRWPMCELINAIFYVLRSVPTNFAPHSTVYRCHELDRNWKVAKEMVGRRLSQEEAKWLLAKLDLWQCPPYGSGQQRHQPVPCSHASKCPGPQGVFRSNFPLKRLAPLKPARMPSKLPGPVALA